MSISSINVMASGGAMPDVRSTCQAFSPVHACLQAVAEACGSVDGKPCDGLLAVSAAEALSNNLQDM